MLDQFTPATANRADLWELIAAALRRAIIGGELGPGVHLQEPLLAQKFGVSRVPVREALARLEHEGLVRSEARRGAFVVGFTEADVREVYDIRLFLETYAGRLVTERATREVVERLQQLVDRMGRAISDGKTDEVAEADIAFHREIIQLAGHRRLLTTWEPLMGVVATILRITNAQHSNLTAALSTHQAIVDAIAAHDPERAEAAIRRHLQNGERTMQASVRNRADGRVVANAT